MIDTESYKAQLQTELAQLTSDLEAIAVLNPETGDWTAKPEPDTIGNADPTDTADTTEEWNERRALMTQLEQRYRNLRRALEKIEAGTFGVCEVCGEPIEPARLQANPAARTNIAHRDQESELPL
jgi:DnaK suppressor protein